MKNKIIIIISSILIVISLIIILGFNIFDKGNKEIEEKIKFTTTEAETTISELDTTTTLPITTTSAEIKKSSTKITTTTKSPSTKKPTTTTKTSKETTTKKLTDIISVDDTFEEASVEYKYGVKITNLNKIRTVTYSDGTISKKQTDTKTEYDHSGYNATTNDLKVEGVSVSNKNSSIYNEMLSYVNQYRNEAESPVPTLSINEELNLAATIRAIEMAWSDKLSHTRPNDLGDCFTIYNDLSINNNAAGENIALGYTSVESVSDGWKNSPGHYANMLKDYFTYVGFGKYELNGKIYWVQMFK